MRLRALLERDVLRGAAAFLPWDVVKEAPLDGGCSVTAVHADGSALSPAVPHTSGLHGFLRLHQGDYRVLIRAASRAFLPSLRSLSVPLPTDSSLLLPAPLRPSSSYPPPIGATVLRGTVHWRRSQPTPARWAAIFARLEAQKGPQFRTVHSMWTRSDENGDFAVFLRPPTPPAEGLRETLRAVVEIYASSPTQGAPDSDDLSDLVLDDGTEDDVRGRQPLARPALVVGPGLEAGATLSLNHDEYTTQPPGSTRPMRHRVILLG